MSVLFMFQFQDFRFLCPNDTVFDQQNLVCTNWFEVDCAQSVQLFAHDFGLRGGGGGEICILNSEHLPFMSDIILALIQANTFSVIVVTF